MSEEEKHAILGRLMSDLAQAKQELALARAALREYAGMWSELAHLASQTSPDAAQRALRLSAELAARDALSRTRERLEDALRLPTRIAEIQATLKDAGIAL